jgi:transketolase
MQAMHSDLNEVQSFAERIRLSAVRMVAPHGFGYLGQALSSAELLAGLFSIYRPDQDTFVCSPGHYIVAAYAAGVEAGLLDPALLKSYGENGSELEAIGTEKSPLVDYVCGSLGQGLSAAAGFALSDQLTGAADGRRVFALVSDGELEEGQLWEAAMFAAHHRLANMTVLLDANNSQVDGAVTFVTTIEPIAEKWRAFGWNAVEVDGHDVGALCAAMRAATSFDQPTVVIGRTSTVHGIAALPDEADGHFIKLSPALAAAAIEELTARIASLASYHG